MHIIMSNTKINNITHQETIIDNTVNGIVETTVLTVNNNQIVTVIKQQDDRFKYSITNYRNMNKSNGYVESYDEAEMKISEKLREIKV